MNSDPDVGDLLKVAFVPDYNVSVAETIIPGTELRRVQRVWAAAQRCSSVHMFWACALPTAWVCRSPGLPVRCRHAQMHSAIHRFGLMLG